MTTITLELPEEKSQFLEKKSKELGLSISQLVASFIDNLENEEDFNMKNDPFYTFEPIRGSGQGIKDLASNHDKYLYGEMSK